MAIKYPNKKFTDNIMNENFENVTNLWSDFSNEMESKLRDLFESSAQEYKEIYKCWTDLSDKMGKQMLGYSMGDETLFKNLYNSWREYSEKLNTDLGKVTKDDDKTYNDFLNFWTGYSEMFTDQLSKLMRDGFKEQYELYELWMDTYAKSADDVTKPGDFPSIVNKYWLETYNKFYDFFSKGEYPPSFQPEKLNSGEQIYKQYEQVYNYWMETSQKMIDDFLRSPVYGNLLAQSINKSMDNKKMIENFMTQNIKSFGIPTRTELEEIREELKNITVKLDDLDKAIRNKK
jgi:hypothetical protein